METKELSDWELFNQMNEAEKALSELREEFYQRQLNTKPFAEYSHNKPHPVIQ